jgi:hypothetical protein
MGKVSRALRWARKLPAAFAKFPMPYLSGGGFLDELGVDKVVMCPGLVNEDRNVRVPALARSGGNADVMLPVNRF